MSILAEATVPDGYIALGWSRDGLMDDSDAVIGWAGHAAAYRLEGKGLSNVVPSSGALAVTLTDASSAVEEGRLLLRFTRPLAAGRIALDPQTPVMYLWAVGSASQLSYHGARRGAFSLALGSGSVAVEVTAIAKAKVLHGVLMLLGWGVLLPSGVLIARFLKWKGPVWLKLHIGLQISGLALGLAGLALALTQFGPLGGSLGGHGQMGLIVSALGLLQPLNGLLRPHKGVIRTPRRRAWEAVHKSLGYLALTLAVPTLVTGILTLDEQEAIALCPPRCPASAARTPPCSRCSCWARRGRSSRAGVTPATSATPRTLLVQTSRRHAHRRSSCLGIDESRDTAVCATRPHGSSYSVCGLRVYILECYTMSITRQTLH